MHLYTKYAENKRIATNRINSKCGQKTSLMRWQANAIPYKVAAAAYLNLNKQIYVTILFI